MKTSSPRRNCSGDGRTADLYNQTNQVICMLFHNWLALRGDCSLHEQSDMQGQSRYACCRGWHHMPLTE